MGVESKAGRAAEEVQAAYLERRRSRAFLLHSRRVIL